MEIQGLKCDNKNCDYKDDTPRSEYESKINAPCPKCGMNLLTQADYNSLVLLERIVSNPFVKAIDWIAKKCGAKQSSVEFNGSGKPIFKEVKK